MRNTGHHTKYIVTTKGTFMLIINNNEQIECFLEK